jgi:AAA domain
MQLIFIYGPVASGKLTIARELAARTGVALFHNHLVVDAVSAVFPFGSESFSRLREQFWLAVFDEAASQGRTLIFTFAPEPTVAPDFPDRVRESIERKGSQIVFVALDLPRAEQERRLVEEGRAAFGKMRDLSLLRKLRPQLDACMAAMPQPALTLDVNDLTPSASAEVISRLISI